MNNTSHTAVLDALSHRSINLCGRVSASSDEERRLHTIDETGTLDLAGLNLYNENEALQQEIREINEIPIPDEVLQVHGFAPPKKAEGTVRLIYQNVNGFNTRLSDNEKVEAMKEIHDDLEIDVAAYCEHKINLKHRKISMALISYSRGEKQLYSQSPHTMYMRMLEKFNKEVPV